MKLSKDVRDKLRTFDIEKRSVDESLQIAIDMHSKRAARIHESLAELWEIIGYELGIDVQNNKYSTYVDADGDLAVRLMQE